jgi:hypothetical protein
VGPHDCSCVETRQTREGTPACRGDDHVCVCNTTLEPNYAAAAAVGVAGLLVAGPIGLAAGVAAGSLSLTPATSSTHACRAATHECSCKGAEGPSNCRATEAAHVCTCDSSPDNCKAQARKHTCRCVETKNPGNCKAKKHACSCKATGYPSLCLAATHDCTCRDHAQTMFGSTASCRSDQHECSCSTGGVKTCRGGTDVTHDCSCNQLCGGIWPSDTCTAACLAPDAAHMCLCAPQAHPYFGYCRSVRGAVPRLAPAPPPPTRAPPPPRAPRAPPRAPPRATRAPRAPRRGRGSRASDPQYVPDSDEDYDDDE